MSEIKVRIDEGIVVSTKMDKVAVVKMEGFVMHPVYNKRIARSKKYFIRDEENKCKDGDKVSFYLCRPQSKRTRYMLKEIITKKS